MVIIVIVMISMNTRIIISQATSKVRMASSSFPGWGDTTDHSIQYGDGPGEMGVNLPVVDLGTGRTASQISSGLWHRCAILDNCGLKCWGAAAFGRLGYGDQAGPLCMCSWESL